MPRIVITELDQPGQPYRFELDRELVRIGRRESNNIVLKCRSSSSDHCTMERIDGGFILRDQGSTNGIKKGKSLMQIIDLKDGMNISMGDVNLSFQLTEEEIKTLSEESFHPHELEKQPASPPESEAPISDQGLPALKESTISDIEDVRTDPAESPSNNSAPAPPAHGQPMIQSSSSSMKPLLIFILVVVAIFTGISVSHKMRTGNSLPTKLIDYLKRTPAADNSGAPEKAADPSEAEN
ncbi:MAG: FHA domain-containing protein [Akkermansiaceae bacterium]|nr:FHA domain-containing protein [Akkermansiaceae bacterium]